MRYDRHRKTFLLAAALAAFASVASAQVIGKTMTVAGLPVCNSPKNFGLVTDATNATTLGAGGGSAHVWVTCASGSWAIAEVAAVSDLSAYLPVSGTTAAPIVIQNSGAGNDGSFIVIDDLILTGQDLLPTFSATAVITAPVTNVVASTSSTITTPTLTAAVTTGVIDAGGGTDELTVTSTSVAVGANTLFYPAKASAPPVACSGGTAGGEYYDTDINKLCRCNGTNFVLANDDSTTTGCS
jgi:hypothetical protein